METKALHAWIIHKEDSGESSVRLTVFTAERGLIRCLCKGGRTPKKQSLLQLFTPSWIFTKSYPNQTFAERIEHEAPTIPLQGVALISALYINELIYRLLKTDYPNQSLFEAYLTTVSGLAFAKNRQQMETLLRRFEWTLLQASGHAIALGQEAHRGYKIEADKYYQFIEGLGLVSADQGLPGAQLLAMSQNDLSDPETLKVAKFVMRKAINHLLEGAEIKTRNLFNS